MKRLKTFLMLSLLSMIFVSFTDATIAQTSVSSNEVETSIEPLEAPKFSGATNLVDSLQVIINELNSDETRQVVENAIQAIQEAPIGDKNPVSWLNWISAVIAIIASALGYIIGIFIRKK